MSAITKTVIAIILIFLASRCEAQIASKPLKNTAITYQLLDAKKLLATIQDTSGIYTASETNKAGIYAKVTALGAGAIDVDFIADISPDATDTTWVLHDTLATVANGTAVYVDISSIFPSYALFYRIRTVNSSATAVDSVATSSRISQSRINVGR